MTGTPATAEPGTLAWSLDDLVYVVRDGRLIAGSQVPEVAQTLYYTSAGILVRTNKDGSSDGGAPFHFRLIGPDGDAVTGQRHPRRGGAVDRPGRALPRLGHPESGRIQVVVHDVVTGHDVGQVDVPGTFTWGGWEAPPVALSGDLVYVATDHQTTVVNWRTGEATTTAVVPAGQVPEVSGGRTVTINTRHQGRPRLASWTRPPAATCSTSRSELDDQVSLSPDGRYVQVVSQGFDPPVRTLAYDVDTGRSVQLPDTLGGYAWTSAGDLFEVRGDRLDVCSPTSGTCDATSVPKFGSAVPPVLRPHLRELTSAKPPRRRSARSYRSGLMTGVRESEIDGVLCFWVDMGRPASCAHLLFRQGLADEPLHESGWLHLLEHLALLDRETLTRPIEGRLSLLPHALRRLRRPRGHRRAHRRPGTLAGRARPEDAAARAWPAAGAGLRGSRPVGPLADLALRRGRARASPAIPRSARCAPPTSC